MGCTQGNPNAELKMQPKPVLKKKKAPFPVEGGLKESKPSVHFAGDLGLPVGSHRKLRIIHFNDCYNIQENPKKPYPGGAARFVTAVNHYQAKARSEGITPLTIFSGDLLSPSLISTIFEGQQMVTSFNRCNVDVACIGNHDLDFGIGNMDKVLKQTMEPQGTCQWLISNLIQEDRSESGLETVGCCLRKAIVTKNDIKIGFIGIAEHQWVALFKNLEVDIIYQNYKRTAGELAKQLREEDDCQYVIAMTHMRVHHDVKFAAQVPGIDLVLGGHDHEYHCKAIDHYPKESVSSSDKVVPLVKSGTDYFDFSEIDVTFDVTHEQQTAQQEEFARRQEDQTDAMSMLMYSTKDQTSYIVNRIRLQDGKWERDAETFAAEEKYMAEFKTKMGETIGYSGVDLESRDIKMRRSETNFGNLLCDLIRTEYATDFAFVNSGSFRKNDVYPAGPITVLNLQESFPFNDQIMVLKMPGTVFKQALEWAVGQYPAEEGRFPQVSNFHFIFDPDQPAGERILPRDIVTIGGGNFNQMKEYTVAMTQFIADGGDGFSMFKDNPDVKTVIDEENGQPVLTILKQFFKRTQTDYEVVPKRELARQMRLKILNVDTSDGSDDGVSPDGKFYKIRPRFEARIRVKGQEVPEDVLELHSQLNPN